MVLVYSVPGQYVCLALLIVAVQTRRLLADGDGSRHMQVS